MHNAVPVDVVALRAEDLEGRGLYEILRSAGRVPRIANQVVGAKAATATEARLLGDPRGAPMLTMTRTAWDESGRGRRVRLPRLPGEPLLLRAHADLLTAYRRAFERTLGCAGRPTPCPLLVEALAARLVVPSHGPA